MRRDPRELAIEAARRGWLGFEDVWEISARCAATRGAASLNEAFGRALTPSQLNQLIEAPLGAPTLNNANDGVVAPPSLPPVARSGSGELTGPRYTLRESLGTGSMGEVVAALDREARRVVALKSLKKYAAGNAAMAIRFIEEARVTANLEHPNIVPVYDVGVAPDGVPFYTMRIVKKRSMHDVLSLPPPRAGWPLVRLVGALLQVSRALAHAHSRGVWHRDIKPGNILLGDFGEVYLADWGIARVDPKGTMKVHGHGSSPPPSGTRIEGTAGYMPPELIKAEWDKVDHRADLFALGVILYEVLADRQPFLGDSPPQIFLATVTKEPRRPVDLNPQCPLLLQDLCLELLAKDPEKRPASAEIVAARIEEYLEGAKERERRVAEASALCDQARTPALNYKQLEAEREQLTKLARELLKSVKGWEPVEKKRPGWALEDLADRSDREAGLALAQAVELYTKALGYDASCAEAHQGLARLYWDRARAAEVQRRPASQGYYEALVTEHDPGTYAALIRADATLSIDTHGPVARVIAQRYFERDRVLIPAEEKYLGTTPLKEARLEPGSYLITLKAEGYRDVRYPVLLPRGGSHEARVALYTEDEIGGEFIYVPAGLAVLGGDAEAYGALPHQTVKVESFAIARFPVTMREYCAFLDDLWTRDQALTLKRAPHDLRGSEGLAVRRVGQGGWEPVPEMIEGEARKLFPIEEGHLWNVPVALIDWFDAIAFCRHRSGVRLPTEAEWEKAARGVDGRFYPWGDRFDPTFCKMMASRPFAPQPEPNGSFPLDTSPYGVQDMAGGMREWVGDIFAERAAAELEGEPEPDAEQDRGDSSLRLIRSGSWSIDQRWARTASRGRAPALTRGTGLTFRLARSLPPRG